MTPEFAYFLKVNVAFALFYAFYRLFFYKDTFFQLRRAILLALFGLAMCYPLFNIEDWVRQQQPIAQVIYIYSTMLPEATAVANGAMAVDWLGWAIRSIGFVYWGMVIGLCGRFLVQLSSILWLAQTSRRMVLREIPVYALAKPAGPFSFFRMIFLHPDSHSEKEVDEILTHERTHVSQWHSLDVIVGELICVICWFNPFVWLLKREVRHNLEYLADNTVLQSGYDCKSYQYHLLGLAHQQMVSSLYNSFNMLHLKNRILMMNKKRSPGIWRAKYLLLIPLVAVVMLLSNIESVLRMASRLTGTATPVAEMRAPEVKVAQSEPETVNKERAGMVEKLETRDKKEVPGNQVFTVVEQMPQFPGGDSELLKYISTSIRYPRESLDKGEEGRVICSFIVTRDGLIRDPEVLRSVAPLLDTEALRVINNMPRWSPGKQRGKAVAVKYTVPITFRLSKASGENAKKDYLTTVDEMPRFPGGEQELLKFIAKSIKYPRDAQENGVQGRVICSFVVDVEGRVVEPEIVRGVFTSLDNEAKRVIAGMPRWTPGKQDGKTVRVLYTVPITFRLQ